MATKKASRYAQLMNAAVVFAKAFGEAQYVNGYRVGNPAREAELYDKELACWQQVGEAEIAFQKLAKKLLRPPKARRTKP